MFFKQLHARVCTCVGGKESLCVCLGLHVWGREGSIIAPSAQQRALETQYPKAFFSP